MPMFDYLCASCGRISELLVRGAQVPPCPACGAFGLSKQVSRPAPPGRSAATVAAARRQAAREGHFSNYAPGERPRN